MPASSSGLSPRAKVLLPVFLVLLAAVSFHRLWWAPLPGPLFELAGESMGTTWNVKLAVESLPREGPPAIAAAVQAELDLVDGRMSTWRPDSELSRFNRHVSREPFALSSETLAVLVVAQEVSELSGGAFDVTIAPLVSLWGFGARARVGDPPSDAEIASALERVGFERLRLDAKAGVAAKSDPMLVCDLSAVAKGYAVDRVADRLAALGYTAFLVEVGGELGARGLRPDGGPWRVAVEAPDGGAGDRGVHLVLGLSELSMATSGDYRSYYELDGMRISHTIDPRDGRPIRHGLASVTVVHPEAARADALATALNVLGPAAGRALAADLDLPAYFIARRASGFETFETEAFAALRRSSAQAGVPASPGALR